MKSAFKRLIPAFLLSGVFGFGVSMFVPFISPYLSNAGFSNSTISYMNSLVAIPTIFLIPLFGKLSDKIGRKKIITAALFLEIISILILSYFAKNLFSTTFAIVLQAAMSITIVLTILALVEDSIKTMEKRGFLTGLNESIYSIGVVLGPLLGALIVSKSSINSIFWISLLILTLLFISIPFLKEHSHEEPKKIEIKDLSLLKELKVFWKNKKLRGMGILGIFMNFVTPVKYVFLPLLVVQELKAPLKYVGIVVACSLSLNLLQFCHGWFCDRTGSRRMVILGCFISALALLGIMTSYSIPNLIVMTVLYSLGMSLWNTSAWCYMSEIGEKINKEGQVVGSYSAIVEIGSFTSFIISGILVSVFGIRPLFMIYSALILFGIFVSLKYFFPLDVKSPLFETTN